MRRRAEIEPLLRDGMSNQAIARQLHCDVKSVARLRAELGMPRITTLKYPSLAEAFRANTRPVDGGHLEWTGERQRVSGTPILRYREQTYTAARLAFRLKNGRDPEGYAYAECGLDQCVAPEHVDDTKARMRTREQLRYLTGGGERPAQCVHGHDQAEHGRYEPDGTAYCKACRRERRRETRQAAS